MGQLWAALMAIPKIASLIEEIWKSYVDFQSSRIEARVDDRAKERLALAKAMMEASTDEERKTLTRLYHRISSS